VSLHSEEDITWLRSTILETAMQSLPKEEASRFLNPAANWNTFLVKYELRLYIRFEAFMAVSMKNGVFWDVTPCSSCKNRRFGGT
jgi:hypothetical protein